MKRKGIVAGIFWIFFFFGCKLFVPDASLSPQTLDQKTADIRSEQISQIEYKLKIDISNKEFFSGKADIYFEFLKHNSPLRIDFANGKISSLKINGNKAEDISYDTGYFLVSNNHLTMGRNHIEIEYTHPYSRSGNGLHIFNDPKDGETYIYSQFETNHAKSMFPCFDQPDLKAVFKLEVIHPSDWKVISSTLPDTKIYDSSRKISDFPETKKFSSYVFSLHAGPFHEWKDEYRNIPLRLMARKSMKQYVDSAFWFKITKQGFGYFENYFGIPYPFLKYDQIIVPEFNFGAMENVGAVTFSERFLTRGKVTRAMKEKTASVILHEMAHMWFGNLVTMKWWDGLWLNESFATYAAAKAQYEATEFKESWGTFFTGMKSWAYKEDRSSTSHPIQGKVSNTDEAFTNFDGITYGKGASVLKQLEYYLGEEVYRKGVSSYLKKFSYSNATLSDFLESLESASGKDIQSWSSDWLEKKGFNRILAAFECTSDGKYLESVTIHQDHITNATSLRTHRTLVGAFKKEEDRFVLLSSQKVEYSDSINKIQWTEKNTACPDYVFPNLDDHDFVQVEYPNDLLDEKNLVKIRSLLNSEDELLTLMLWKHLFDEVRDGDLSIQRYSRLAMETLPIDKRDIILESNLHHITGDHFPSHHSFLYLKKTEDRVKDLKDLESWTWENMQSAPSFSDKKKLWFRAYIQVAHSQEFMNRSIAVLKNQTSINGLPIDQDLRWNIFKKICSLDTHLEKIEPLLEKELAKDNTKFGKDAYLACHAANPDPVTKSKWMNILLSPSEEYTASTLRSIMYNIFPVHQLNLQIPFVEFYFQNLKEGKVGGDENYLEIYSEVLAPRFCTEENRLLLKKFVRSNTKLPVSIYKNLNIALESEEECIQIRRKSGI